MLCTFLFYIFWGPLKNEIVSTFKTSINLLFYQYYPAPKPGMCPSTDSMLGICVEECSSDTDCQDKHKCCSNGCGRTCTDPIIMRKWLLINWLKGPIDTRIPKIRMSMQIQMTQKIGLTKIFVKMTETFKKHCFLFVCLFVCFLLIPMWKECKSAKQF